MNPEYTNPGAQTSPPAAFCQNCGRPLTSAEVRAVGGHVYCEPCLAARVGAVSPAAAPPYGVPYPTPIPGNHSPLLAGLLGTIPGVGAMYNGQFIKGIVHVLIFIALISATTHFGLLGIAIAVWYIYMIFDAVQTAQAIRMGMPLPDPLGLNNVGQKLGIQSAGVSPNPYAPPVTPVQPNPYVPPVPPIVTPPPGSYSESVAMTPVAPMVSAEAPPYEPPAAAPPYPPVPPPVAPRTAPVGAIILVALGALFLLGTLSENAHWIEHGWPVLLIVLGAWLFYRNASRNGGLS